MQFKGAKPGVMGEDLRRALGMADNTPPPWLINMQRYGPPPSYPDLKVRPCGGSCCVLDSPFRPCLTMRLPCCCSGISSLCLTCTAQAYAPCMRPDSLSWCRCQG